MATKTNAWADVVFLLEGELSTTSKRVRDLQKTARMGRLYGASEEAITRRVVEVLREDPDGLQEELIAAHPFIRRLLGRATTYDEAAREMGPCPGCGVELGQNHLAGCFEDSEPRR